VSFDTVLGALAEYYRKDAEDYGGANVEMVQAELARKT